MTGKEELAGPISTSRFADLLCEYERLGVQIEDLKARREAFETTPAEAKMPAAVSSVEEYRHRAFEGRQIEAARAGELTQTEKELSKARSARAETLRAMLGEGVPEGVWIQDPLRGPKHYLLVSSGPRRAVVLHRASRAAVRRGTRQGLTSEQIVAGSGTLALVPVLRPALRAGQFLCGLTWIIVAAILSWMSIASFYGTAPAPEPAAWWWLIVGSGFGWLGCECLGWWMDYDRWLIERAAGQTRGQPRAVCGDAEGGEADGTNREDQRAGDAG